MSLIVLAVISFAFVKLQFLQAHGSELLLSCGSNGTVDADTRRWIGDMAPGGNFTLSSPGFAVSLAGNNSADENFGPVYRSARFFDTPTWYTISVLPGSYCIRLHFFPSMFGNFSANNSLFDVTANDFKLVEMWCLREAMKIGGGNGYDTPHMKKGMLERQGRLPLQLKCEASLVQNVMEQISE